MGITARSPSLKHQRKKLACRTGNRKDNGSAFMAAAPSKSAFISSSVSATAWFRGRKLRARAYAVIRSSRRATTGVKAVTAEGRTLAEVFFLKRPDYRYLYTLPSDHERT